MFFLFASASVVPTCFCAFIASNSFGTMLPRIPKTASTLVGVTIGALLAITHVAQNFTGFFVIMGASFGPICGPMAADYLLAGKRWSGPRAGINWVGYIASALAKAGLRPAVISESEWSPPVLQTTARLA